MIAFPISEYGLDVKPYHDNWMLQHVRWNKCTLRMWLNQEFKDIAFTKQEQQAIAKLQNPRNGQRKLVDPSRI